MDFKSRKLTDRDIRIFIFNIDRKYSLEQLLKQILKKEWMKSPENPLNQKLLLNR